MALDVKELCRLFGKKEEFYKDLKDEDNKYILKMIQEFIQIPFAEHDELPTKVCLNCEETIESFQLFVLECYNVQEILRQMYLQTCEKYPIKLEDDIVIDDNFNNSAIKSEVKHELSNEDLVNANNRDECMTGANADDYNNDNDDDDNVTLATLNDLKQEKTSERKRMTLTKTGMEHLKEISDLNTGDFSEFECREHWRAVHDKVKPHVCDECGRACVTAYSLRQHRATAHSDDRPFACRTCDKRFKTRAILRDHQFTHDDKRCHVCSHCGKAFRQRRTLEQVHIHSHTGDKPPTCEWCDMLSRTRPCCACTSSAATPTLTP